jgi:hypothetical protein
VALSKVKELPEGLSKNSFGIKVYDYSSTSLIEIVPRPFTEDNIISVVENT